MMETTELRLIKPQQKTPSPKQQIIDLKIGEDINAPYDEYTTLRPIISQIKRELKGRDYETNKFTMSVSGKQRDYLNIKRTA